MAEKIYDNISEISKAIKDLNKQATVASRNTKSLNEDLRFDSTNVELAKQRFDALNRELKAYSDYQQKLIEHENSLRLAQQKGIDRLSKLDKSSAEYVKLEKELQQYNTELTKTEKAADRASSQIKRLQAAIKGVGDKTETLNKQLKVNSLKRYNEGLNGLQQGISKLQVKLLLLLGTIAKITKEAITQGTELYALSKRYKTSAENIQLWNKALQLATGDNDLFTESLKTMSKGLSTIPVGRGVAYNNALKAIGISYKELEGLDPSKQFERILEGLSTSSNAASYALTLFGESGQTIINALRDGDETMEQYLERAKEFVAYTSEDTKTLTELGFQLDIAKVKLQRATVELAVNATPVIVGILDILRVTALPLLKGLTSQIWLLKTAFGLLIALMVTKGLIAFAQLIIQIGIAAAEQKSFLMWTLGAKAAILGLAGVVGVIATVGAAMSSVNSQIEDFADTANDAYSAYGNDLSTNVTQTATAVTERTITMNVDIKAEGNNPISDENAKQVAQLTVDGLQKYLGDLIK